jgi:glycosyltransferase involved in cell wall biosynthesis
MTISIITATYNSAVTIKDTLECILHQDYPFIEHIIVDGFSSDNTLQIVRGFPHVSKIISEKDKGIYDAMNKGIAAANGEIIGILNSDDIYSNSFVLSKIASVFKEDKVDACYADLQYVHPRDTNKIIRTWRSGNYKPLSFYKGWMPPHPTLFVRRRVYEEAGNFNISLKSAADYEFMLRIFVKHSFQVRYIPEFIVKMRTGGISNASFKHRIEANKEDRKAWKLNGLRPGFLTLYLKPMRKINQFLTK